MRRTVLIATAGLLVHGICAAQSGPDMTGAPGGAQQTMVRAAGMPLNDGTLAPGMLTVRIVRGAFTANVADHAVQIEQSGRPAESARTDAAGRATFAHLPPGTQVRAVADVDGHYLTSETFTMPADTGVRLLLVVDGEAGDMAGLPEGHPSVEAGMNQTPMSESASATNAAARDVPLGVTAIRIVLSMMTVLAVAMVIFRPRFRGRERL
jgi:hypothetical protein